jgi:hypothetical protein
MDLLREVQAALLLENGGNIWSGFVGVLKEVEWYCGIGNEIERRSWNEGNKG